MYKREKDFRDSDVTDPDAYFAFVAPRTQPKTINYVLISSLESMKNGNIPKKGEFSGGANYYKNTEGHYGGQGSMEYFLEAPEILEWMQSDPEFIRRCIEAGALHLVPKDVQDIFVFEL